MWQTVIVALLFIGATVYVVRHFLNLYRNGSDCGCSGCSSSGCCGTKPHGVDQSHIQEQSPSSSDKRKPTTLP